ncbi:MAG: FAD:protein FMN transferase [Saprospiraceae bacterium]|nr:FAD:protein FMN transferase [Saprospiraceae bacterium]
MRFCIHFSCILVLLLFSCKKKEQTYTKITGKAQGTTYAITFENKHQVLLRGEIDSIFNVIDKSMSLWDSSSSISKFNQAAESYAVDDHFGAVFKKSQDVYALSEGAFDPTVGTLIKHLGFVRKNKLPAPTQQTIDSLLQNVGFSKASLKGQTIFKTHRHVQLDFNAIAQGYTVDVLAAQLEKHQINDYMVELGGEVITKGKNKQGSTWRIGIEKPTENDADQQNSVQNILGLTNVSLATSGNYRNFIEKDGKRFSHIINPKTGKSAEQTVLSVSVLAPTCAEADAWATAFMVLGKDKSLELAQKMGFDIQIIMSKDKGLDIVQTEGFKKRIIQTP